MAREDGRACRSTARTGPFEVAIEDGTHKEAVEVGLRSKLVLTCEPAVPREGSGIGFIGMQVRGSMHDNDEQVKTYAISRHDQMVLENDREIDWWWSLLAKVFSWLLLAGYIVFPSTFASLRRSQVLENTGGVGQAVSEWVNDCLIALASVLSGVASIGLAWLWFKWRANYVWVHQHIVM
ncbi:hypothetical protein K456DRAFT_38016 [Colletotrichum gloeosporioides 23]|nr:hypothetical protein K456DRAFT_38016 [Colletotrichum gloeosporioides 23]